MQQLLCATTNQHKFGQGVAAFRKYAVDLQQVVIDIDEIQGEDSEYIIRDKVKRAYEAVGQPVVVTDDSWSIPGLGGFPGAYMKSINHWFTPDDFIRLTRDLADRAIYIHQFVAYKSELQTVVFSHDIPGHLLTEARGQDGPPIMKVVSLTGENGASIAETYDQGLKRNDPAADAWHQLASWYHRHSMPLDTYSQG